MGGVEDLRPVAEHLLRGVLVVEAARVEGWLEVARGAGLDPDAILPDASCLPVGPLLACTGDRLKRICSEPEAQEEILCEINVVEQVDHLAKMSVIQRAWRTEGRPWLHGWVYDLHTGLVRTLEQVDT